MKADSLWKKNSFLRSLASAGIAAMAVFPLVLAFGANSPLGIYPVLACGVLAGLASMLGGKGNRSIWGPACPVFLVFLFIHGTFGAATALVSSLLAGAVLFILSFFDCNKLIHGVPAPVRGGFLFGLSVAMAVIQVNHYFGIGAWGASALSFVKRYQDIGFHPNWRTMLYGTIMLVVVIVWPRTFKKFSKIVPASLVGIFVTLGLNFWLVPNPADSPFDELGALSQMFLPARGFWHSLSSINWPVVGFCVLVLVLVILLEAGREGPVSPREVRVLGLTNALLACAGGLPATCVRRDEEKTPWAGGLFALFLAAGALLSQKALARLPLSVLAVILIAAAWYCNDWRAVKQSFKSVQGGLLFVLTAVDILCWDIPSVFLICTFGGALLCWWMAKKKAPPQALPPTQN